MKFFVREESIVRKIWGKADTILFIFAGASAEFALNKAVDWLYFTGRLPADPLERLFSTVSYAQQIVFSEYKVALDSIDSITAIHKGVEKNRGAKIPDWAYRDVLFMLIDYSIRSFELLERRLTETEKAETFEVFYRVGLRMELKGLPTNYGAWKIMRKKHLRDNLICSTFTLDLYKQYKRNLGLIRFQLLKQAQVLIVPGNVHNLLSLGRIPMLFPVIQAYKLSRKIKMDRFLKNVVFPHTYQVKIQHLDRKQ